MSDDASNNVSSSGNVSSDFSGNPAEGSAPVGDVGAPGDDALMREAIAMANGSSPEAPVSPPPSPAEVQQPDHPTGTGSLEKSETQTTKESGPTSQEWAKFYKAQKEFETQRAELDKGQTPFKEFQKAKESGDIQAMIKLMGFDDGVKFLETVANHGAKLSPEALKMQTLEKEMQALRQEREQEREKVQQAERTARVQQATAEVRSGIDTYLKAEGKESLVNITGGADAVFEKMKTHYLQTKQRTGKGEEISPAKATQLLEQEWEAGLKEFAKLPKFRKLMQDMLSGADSRPATKAVVPLESAAKGPAVSHRDLNDKEIEEAINIMRARDRARQAG